MRFGSGAVQPTGFCLSCGGSQSEVPYRCVCVCVCVCDVYYFTNRNSQQEIQMGNMEPLESGV